MIKIDKLKERLAEVEKGCSARLLDLKYSLKQAEKIEDIVEILKISPSEIVYREHDGDNRAGYTYSATEIVVNYNKTNINIKSVDFNRSKFYEAVRRFEIDVTENTQLEKRLIKRVLELQGYEVSSASDGFKQHIYIQA